MNHLLANTTLYVMQVPRTQFFFCPVMPCIPNSVHNINQCMVICLLQGMPPQFQYFPTPAPPMHLIGMPPHRPPNTNHQMPHSIPTQHGGQPPPLNQQQSAAKHQATLDKQLVNETIRRRISDKMLAQQVSHVIPNN